MAAEPAANGSPTDAQNDDSDRSPLSVMPDSGGGKGAAYEQARSLHGDTVSFELVAKSLRTRMSLALIASAQLQGSGPSTEQLKKSLPCALSCSMEYTCLHAVRHHTWGLAAGCQKKGHHRAPFLLQRRRREKMRAHNHPLEYEGQRRSLTLQIVLLVAGVTKPLLLHFCASQLSDESCCDYDKRTPL